MTTRNAVLLAIAAGHARELRAVLDGRVSSSCPCRNRRAANLICAWSAITTRREPGRLFHREQFDLEDQGLIGRDRASTALLAVAKVVGNDELCRLALLH